MILDKDRAKYALPVKPPSKKSVVEKADELVDIRDILKQMGRWTPEGTFYSYKIDCPYNYEHADGGLDKNCRIFPPSNIYCWAHDWYITPTVLFARWKGVSRKAAAETLLDERGLLKKPWRETWNDLISSREETVTGLGSKNDIVAALHTALAAFPEYAQYEFSDLVRNKWSQVLVALDALWEIPDVDFDKINKFFDRSLQVLRDTAIMVGSEIK